MRLLLDTCCILWAVSDPTRLSPGIADLLVRADSEVWISPISCAEIACLADRGRIALNRHWKPWFNDNVGRNGWMVADIGPAVIQEAYSLPGGFHADPADRILVATARLLDARLLTADRKLLDYPHVKAVW